MKEILNVIHNTIYQFFDVCSDDEEVPMSDKDKLLLEVNKAICNNLKALDQQPCEDCISRADVLGLAKKGVLISNSNYQSVCKAINELPSVTPIRKNSISRQAVYEQINCWIGSGEYRYTNATDYLIKRITDIESLEQQLCEDCISREKAKQFLYERLDRLNDDELYDIFSRIIDDMYNELPPVTPSYNSIKTELKSCDDCISRQAVLNTLDYIDKVLDEDRTVEKYKEMLKECYEVLPPVTPNQKMGHWVYDYISADGHKTYHCSECGCYLKPKHSEP